MRGEHALGQRAGLEQCKAQQHRVSRHAPDAHNNVIGEDNAPDQHRVNADANHDEKALEA